SLPGSFATVWPVFTEAVYLLNFSWKAQDNLWEFIMRGGVDVLSMDDKQQIRCRQLMKIYADLPMDLADGTLVVLAESKKVKKVFTLDHKDFQIYKISQKLMEINIKMNLEFEFGCKGYNVQVK
ncbi:MAG: PIN domain-containing protein, partial [Candidatus Lokiarchaeota archaeon]